MKDERLLPTFDEQGSQVRVTRYNTKPETVMANCAKVTSSDHHASEGVVHTLERVMQPATASILDTLQSDSQFNSFLSALEAHGLAEELSKPGAITVFAPTDEAMARLDEETRAKLSGGSCGLSILHSHILKHAICSGAICCDSVPTMSRLRVRSHLGSQVTMRRNRRGGLLADTAELVRCDSVAENGLVHSINNLVGGRTSWQF